MAYKVVFFDGVAATGAGVCALASLLAAFTAGGWAYSGYVSALERSALWNSSQQERALVPFGTDIPFEGPRMYHLLDVERWRVLWTYLSTPSLQMFSVLVSVWFVYEFCWRFTSKRAKFFGYFMTRRGVATVPVKSEIQEAVDSLLAKGFTKGEGFYTCFVDGVSMNYKIGNLKFNLETGKFNDLELRLQEYVPTGIATEMPPGLSGVIPTPMESQSHSLNPRHTHNGRLPDATFSVWVPKDGVAKPVWPGSYKRFVLLERLRNPRDGLGDFVFMCYHTLARLRRYNPLEVFVVHGHLAHENSVCRTLKHVGGLPPNEKCVWLSDPNPEILQELDECHSAPNALYHLDDVVLVPLLWGASWSELGVPSMRPQFDFKMGHSALSYCVDLDNPAAEAFDDQVTVKYEAGSPITCRVYGYVLSSTETKAGGSSSKAWTIDNGQFKIANMHHAGIPTRLLEPGNDKYRNRATPATVLFQLYKKAVKPNGTDHVPYYAAAYERDFDEIKKAVEKAMGMEDVSPNITEGSMSDLLQNFDCEAPHTTKGRYQVDLRRVVKQLHQGGYGKKNFSLAKAVLYNSDSADTAYVDFTVNRTMRDRLEEQWTREAEEDLEEFDEEAFGGDGSWRIDPFFQKGKYTKGDHWDLRPGGGRGGYDSESPYAIFHRTPIGSVPLSTPLTTCYSTGDTEEKHVLPPQNADGTAASLPPPPPVLKKSVAFSERRSRARPTRMESQSPLVTSTYVGDRGQPGEFDRNFIVKTKQRPRFFHLMGLESDMVDSLEDSEPTFAYLLPEYDSSVYMELVDPAKSLWKAASPENVAKFDDVVGRILSDPNLWAMETAEFFNQLKPIIGILDGHARYSKLFPLFAREAQYDSVASGAKPAQKSRWKGAASKSKKDACVPTGNLSFIGKSSSGISGTIENVKPHLAQGTPEGYFEKWRDHVWDEEHNCAKGGRPATGPEAVKKSLMHQLDTKSKRPRTREFSPELLAQYSSGLPAPEFPNTMTMKGFMQSFQESMTANKSAAWSSNELLGVRTKGDWMARPENLISVLFRICLLGATQHALMRTATPTELFEANLIVPEEVFIKQEIHKLSKHKDERWRTIWNCAASTDLQMRILHHYQNKAEIEQYQLGMTHSTEFPYFGGFCGMGHDDAGIKHVCSSLKHMLEFDCTSGKKIDRQNNGISLDAKGYDISVTFGLMMSDAWRRVDAARAGGAPEFFAVATWNFGISMSNHIVCIAGDLYQVNQRGIVGSGIPSTTATVSFTRGYLHASGHHVVDKGLVPALSCVMGDDTVGKDEVSQEVLDAWKSFGADVTPSAKDGDVFQCTPLDKPVDFTSHYFDLDSGTAEFGNGEKLLLRLAHADSWRLGADQAQGIRFCVRHTPSYRDLVDSYVKDAHPGLIGTPFEAGFTLQGVGL